MNSLIASDVYGVNSQMAWLSFRKTLSDEEHIDAIRRSMIVFDRWRPWLIALYFAILIGIAVLLPKAVMLCVAFAGNNALAGNNNAGWILTGLATGLVIGVSMGYLFGHTFHQLVTLVGFGRNERLLVRYHDALQEALRRLPSKPSDSDNSQATDG